MCCGDSNSITLTPLGTSPVWRRCLLRLGLKQIFHLWLSLKSESDMNGCKVLSTVHTWGGSHTFYLPKAGVSKPWFGGHIWPLESLYLARSTPLVLYESLSLFTLLAWAAYSKVCSVVCRGLLRAREATRRFLLHRMLPEGQRSSSLHMVQRMLPPAGHMQLSMPQSLADWQSLWFMPFKGIGLGHLAWHFA